MKENKRLGRNVIRSVQIVHHQGVEVPDFPRIEKVVHNLRHLPQGRLLDVGYSEGGFADYLAKDGWECTGLDLNAHSHPRIKSIECDLNERFPVASEAFDVVTAGGGIEHMLYEGGVLDEWHRVLKKAGAMVVTTPQFVYFLNPLAGLFGESPLLGYS